MNCSLEHCRSWRELSERQEHDAWKRTRVLTAICIQPHAKGRMTPEKTVAVTLGQETDSKK